MREKVLQNFDIYRDSTLEIQYCGTPLARPTPSVKAAGKCKSKHKCIDFYP